VPTPAPAPAPAPVEAPSPAPAPAPEPPRTEPEPPAAEPGAGVGPGPAPESSDAPGASDGLTLRPADGLPGGPTRTALGAYTVAGTAATRDDRVMFRAAFSLDLGAITLPRVDAIALSIVPTPLAMGDVSISGLRASGNAADTATMLMETFTAERLQVTGTLLSIGAVWWISRGATLISSLLLTTPVWRQIDPLPVFDHRGHADEDGPEDDDASGPDTRSGGPRSRHRLDEQAETLFDRRSGRDHSIIG